MNTNDHNDTTWKPGTIPPPNPLGLVVDEYLAVRCGSDSITKETYWHDIREWRDADDNILQIAAWVAIPMDGLDAAIRQNEVETTC